MSLVIRMARAGTKSGRSITSSSPKPQPPRRPFHRAAGLFQSAAAEGKDRAAEWDVEKAKAWMAKGAQPPTASCVSSTPPA